MSYDLILTTKNQPSTPLKKEQLEKEFKDIIFTIIESNEKNEIGVFTTALKENLEWSIDFNYIEPNAEEREYGGYFVSIPYFREPNIYEKFFKIVTLTAEYLELNIFDPQLNIDTVSSQEYIDKYIPLILTRFKNNYEYNRTKSAITWQINMPAASKFFIKYFILTTDTEGKQYCLIKKDNTLYASKVEPSQYPREVIKNEMNDIFKSPEYEVVFAINEDKAQDKLGNWLQRKSIYVKVPYFNPNDKGLNEWEWVPQEFPDLFIIPQEEYKRLQKDMFNNTAWGQAKKN